LVDGDEECGDIAESADDFGVGLDGVEIDEREEPGAAISAADGEDGFDRGICEGPIEVIGALLIGASEVGPFGHEVGGKYGFERERFDPFLKIVEVFLASDWASGGDEGNSVAGPEGLGFDG
jgi:hypothetical protein